MPKKPGLCDSVLTLGFPSEEARIILDCSLCAEHQCQHEVMLIQDGKVITVFWEKQYG